MTKRLDQRRPIGMRKRPGFRRRGDASGIELVGQDLDDLPDGRLPLRKLVERGGTPAELRRVAVMKRQDRDRQPLSRRNPEQAHAELHQNGGAVAGDRVEEVGRKRLPPALARRSELMGADNPNRTGQRDSPSHPVPDGDEVQGVVEGMAQPPRRGCRRGAAVDGEFGLARHRFERLGLPAGKLPSVEDHADFHDAAVAESVI